MPTSASRGTRRSSSSTRRWGWSLDAADVDALEERTEGWIAGLQLAALSLRAIPTRPEVDGLHRGVHRQQPVRHRLPGRRGPGPTTDRGARLPAANGRPRPAHRSAVRRGEWAVRRRRDARGPRARQPVRRPAGHRALLVPLPPPVRRRAARAPAHRGPRPGAAAAPARQRLVRVARPRRGRRPARPGRRGLRSRRLPGGGSAARRASRATGQPAAQRGSGHCRTRSSAAARC